MIQLILLCCHMYSDYKRVLKWQPDLFDSLVRITLGFTLHFTFTRTRAHALRHT
jgi:hypothetical protein